MENKFIDVIVSVQMEPTTQLLKVGDYLCDLHRKRLYNIFSRENGNYNCIILSDNSFLTYSAKKTTNPIVDIEIEIVQADTQRYLGIPKEDINNPEYSVVLDFLATPSHPPFPGSIIKKLTIKAIV